ncbi:hypothetical protein KIN34_03305 [Cellulomonas sp. DKR-3]|uniref:LppM domain-containing protein n=1 Tax=Cellulomonas fulva TaxID=2835530 RepID=A0ABS5TW23_9CELL|nr:hypothetical protein [Cellulomonas fulva]MBT0993313.1 hypothetical protein [Cellulomonas fulva]
MMTTKRRPARPLALLGTVAALLLVLSGCMKVDLQATFTTDDTVDGTMLVAIDKQLLETTGGSVDDVLGSDEDLFDNGKTTSEPYEEGDYVGRTYTFADVPLDEFGGDEEMQISHADGKFTVDGELDLSSSQLGESATGGEVTITFTFPGDVEEANGAIDGNSVTWAGEAGDVLEINAVASDSGNGFPILTLVWLLAGLVLLALVVVITVVLLRRRSSRREGLEPHPAYDAVPAAGDAAYGAAPPAAAPVGSMPPAGAVPPVAPPPVVAVPPAPPADVPSPPQAAAPSDEPAPAGPTDPAEPTDPTDPQRPQG